MRVSSTLSRNYRSFETIPADIYFKILESRDPSPYLGKGLKAQKRWDVIYNDFLKFYGISKEYRTYLEKMRKAIKLYDQAYNKGQIHKKLIADLTFKEAQSYLTTATREDIAVVVASVSMRVGFPLKLEDITAKEFYAYLKALRDKDQAEKENQAKQTLKNGRGSN